LEERKAKLAAGQSQHKLEKADSMDLVRKREQEQQTAQRADTIKLWLGELIGEPLPEEEMFTILKDGVVLCKAMQALKPTKPLKFNKTPKMQMHEIENIGVFLTSCQKEFGFREVQLFRANELNSGSNMKQVMGVLSDLMQKATKN